MSRKGEQKDLPGMTNRRIEDLHAKALEYAAIHDERMELSKKESDLKGELLSLMHKHKKNSYILEGVEIYIENSEETVKVKVHKSGNPDSEANAA